MVSSGDNRVIVVAGPTASGKSELAQQIAQELDGEIISADSMQIYRGMNIGTGKVMPDEMRVAHWGIDIKDPGEPFSAALFQNYARECISDIQARGKVAILCGGTGFYLRAAIDDYDFSEGEQEDNPVRRKFEELADEISKHELWEQLQAVDADSATVIEPNDTKRVIRALELHERGESYAKNKESLASIKELIPSYWLGLQVDRDILANRISDRVDAMVAAGLVDEVKGLLDEGFRDALCAPKAIGYREIVDYLDGKTTLAQAIADIKTNTRRYAKRQRTWFRAEKRINWVDFNDPTTYSAKMFNRQFNHVGE